MISKSQKTTRRSRRFWICSVLLLAQLLTVAPILLIVIVGQRQSAFSQRVVLLLQDLDQLAVPFRDLQTAAQDAAKQPASIAHAWQQHQSQYRDAHELIARRAVGLPAAQELLPRMDAIVDRMAQTETAIVRPNVSAPLTDQLIAQFLEQNRSALYDLAAAQRIIRLQLSIVTGGIAEKAGYLKVLVAAACLLALGMVFAFRRFRIDSVTQRRLEQSLRRSNDEVIAALAAVREGSDAKNEALINVGDALRAPLTGMITLTTKLLETKLTAEQRDCAQAGLHSALSLARVIRDIQDFAKMESGKLDLELEEFRPTKVIEDTLDAFRIAAGQKGLEIQAVIAARLPALARGDAGRLGQILTNLLDNAVKFTERGRIVLSATEVNRSEGRTKLRFEIKDTGIGISQQIRDRLFEPSPQSGRSSASEHGGFGLGLAISKKLVELMGGEIDVVSTPSHGSTFWFTVVLEHRPAHQGLPPDTSEKATGGTRRQPREAPPADIRPARDKRVESRHRMNYPTLLKSKTAGVALVRVLDVSGFGLRVSAPFRLPSGTEVEIRIENVAVRGLVRNCACIRATEFHVGVELLQSDSIDERGLADFVSKRTTSRLKTKVN